MAITRHLYMVVTYSLTTGGYKVLSFPVLPTTTVLSLWALEVAGSSTAVKSYGLALTDSAVY